MNLRRCCEVAAGDLKRETTVASATFARRCRDLAGWIVPSTILALIPKCPICLAAYLALGTGVGLSMTTAAYVRMLLVFACISSLALFAAKSIARQVRRRPLNVAD